MNLIDKLFRKHKHEYELANRYFDTFFNYFEDTYRCKQCGKYKIKTSRWR
jgi:hypothetical protein